MSFQIIPFQKEYIPQAAKLLARRHKDDRIAVPELPARFEDPMLAQKAIEALCHRKQVYGFVALDNDRLVAYLIGDMVIEQPWGRTGWMRTSGCAYDPQAGVEVMRDMYAALGEIWVSYGVFTHFALIPVADPEMVHAWFSLSFGIEQVHALLDLEVQNPVIPSIPPDLEVRIAGSEDRERLAGMSDVIWKEQVKAPVWGVMVPETIGEVRDGWSELTDEEEVTVWLALKGGKTVALQGYWPAEQSDADLHIPDRCVHLSIAGTREDARRKGFNTLLTRYGLAKAYVAGYRYCETDWRSTNLLASRFWPRFGFRPAVYRLARRVDQRIAWAHGTDTE